MDTLATTILIAFALIFGAFILSRFLGRQRKRPFQYDAYSRPYGDAPAIPGEMAATRKARGDEAASGSGRLEQDVIARRHSGSV